MRFEINEIMLNQRKFGLSLKPLVKCALVIRLDVRFNSSLIRFLCFFVVFLGGN